MFSAASAATIIKDSLMVTSAGFVSLNLPGLTLYTAMTVPQP